MPMPRPSAAVCRTGAQRVLSVEVMAMVGGVRDGLGPCRDAGSLPQWRGAGRLVSLLDLRRDPVPARRAAVTALHDPARAARRRSGHRSAGPHPLPSAGRCPHRRRRTTLRSPQSLQRRLPRRERQSPVTRASPATPRASAGPAAPPRPPHPLGHLAGRRPGHRRRRDRRGPQGHPPADRHRRRPGHQGRHDRAQPELLRPRRNRPVRPEPAHPHPVPRPGPPPAPADPDHDQQRADQLRPGRGPGGRRADPG